MDGDLEVAAQLRALLQQPEAGTNVAAAALLVASAWQPGLDVRRPMQELAALANGLRGRVGSDLAAETQAAQLASYLAGECGFRGNTADYYDPANSFLNDVVMRRTGLPITLSLVYLEVGRRLGFRMDGIGFPGHFIVGLRAELTTVYIDPFHGGKRLANSDLEDRLRLTYGRDVPLRSGMLQRVSSRDIILRMLRNLKQAYLRRDDAVSALIAVRLLRELDPADLGELRDMGVLLYHLNRWDQAREALGEYRRRRPDAADSAYVRRLLDTTDRLYSARN